MNSDPFNVALTGVRAGEKVIANRGKDNVAGSSMVFIDDFPVLRSWYESLTFEREHELLTKVSSLTIFAGKTASEIKDWLVDNTLYTKGKEVYLNDFNIRVRDVVLGGSDFARYLTEADIESFARPSSAPGGYWTIKDIYNRCIRNRSTTSAWEEGKDDGKAVLVFRPNLWIVAMGTPQAYEGFYVDLTAKDNKSLLSEGCIVNGTNDVGRLFTLWGVPYGVLARSREIPLTRRELLDCVKKRFPGEDETVDSFAEEIEPFEGGYYKSLMQKIMRSAALQVYSDKQSWYGPIALCVDFVLLVNHPGAFHPDLQTFVSGAESAFKRAAVTILEDSYISRPEPLVRLLTRAILCKQHHKVWIPTLDDVVDSLDTILKAYYSDSVFDYPEFVKENTPILPRDPLDAKWCVHAQLTECGSFKGDIAMVAHIVANKWATAHLGRDEIVIIREKIPLIHAIDMHSIPDYVYCFDWSSLNALGYLSFEQVVGSTWKYSSAYNPRRRASLPSATNTPFVGLLRIAQQRTYDLLRKNPRTQRVKTGNEMDIEGRISEGYLCGIIGSRKIKAKNGKWYLVSTNPYSLKGRVVMASPTTRLGKTNDKSSQTVADNKSRGLGVVIPEDVRLDAIRIFDALLENGVILTKRHVGPYYWFTGYTLKYDRESDEYVLNDNISSNSRPWRDFLTPSALVDLVERLNSTTTIVDGALRTTAMGLDANWSQTIKKLLTSLPTEDLVSLQSTLQFSIEYIEFPSVNIQGKGTAYVAKLRDLIVVETLSAIAVATPFALHRTNQRIFKISFQPLINKILDIIVEEIFGRRGSVIGHRWRTIQDKTRTPHGYQLDIIERLSSNDRVHIIDADAGSGKTLCVFADIQRKIANGTMPSYILYFTIKTGIETAIKEANLFGLDSNVVVPLLNRKTRNDVIIPGVVNVIKYDHGRMNGLEEKIIAIVSDSYVIFDEFDTVLNPCQKTSAAIGFIRRSKYAVALSATPLKDRHIEYLIPWLQQLVPFSVVYSNIWTAIGAMISKRVDYGITVVKNRVEAIFMTNELVEYELLMSAPLGGRINPRDFHRAVNMCFTVSLREQVRQTIEWLNIAPVFLVVRKREEQQLAKELLIERGLKENEIGLIGEEGTTTTYLEGDDSTVRVLITTVYNTRSYTATKMGVLIQGVFFVSEATRIQTLGRIKRQTQKRKEIYEVTVHAGLLSKVLERYDSERSMIDAARSISEIVGGDLIGSW